MSGIEEIIPSLQGRKFKGRGRPKKGCTDITHKELGVTRQQMYEARKLAEIPQEEFERFMANRRHQGKPASRRSILVHFGKRNNVVSDDSFVGTPFGDLAETILRGFERVSSEMTPAQRRLLARALKYRIREICPIAEMNDEKSPKKRNRLPQERPIEVPMTRSITQNALPDDFPF